MFLNRYLLLFFGFNVFKTNGEASKGCWPFNVIPYRIEKGFSEWQRQQILSHISQINRATCVRWADISGSELLSTNVAVFVHSDQQEVCKMKGQFKDGRYEARISLSEVCFTTGAVMHEMLHVLGFEHEHQRSDRDCYVTVDQDEVRENGLQSLFKIVSTEEWLERFPYDKLSVMHYRRDTMIKAKSEHWYEFEPLGNIEGKLTDIDLWKIRYRHCQEAHYCDSFPSICASSDKAEQACRKSVQPFIDWKNPGDS